MDLDFEEVAKSKENMAHEYEGIKVALRFMTNGIWQSKELLSLRPADSMYECPDLLRDCCKNVKGYMELQVEEVFGKLPKMYFIDQEGDWVLLCDLDSYVEAMKDAKKSNKLVLVVEETKREASAATSANTWLVDEMLKLKTELKNEILSEISKSGIVSAPENTAADRSTPMVKLMSSYRYKSEGGKGDYISRALKIAGGVTGASKDDKSKPEQPVGGAKPKKLKGDYIARALKTDNVNGKGGVEEGKEVVMLCGVCGNKVGEPYFMCLDSDCMAMLCRNCENQHPVGHAMLRLPKQLDGGRRFAASTARMILLTMKSSRQVRKKHEKKSKEEKALKKAVKEAGYVKPNGKRSAEFVTVDVTVDDAGVATITWMIINTGKKPWDNDVKLMCLACSTSDLKPVEWDVAAPLLKPGEDAFVSVKVTTPRIAGEYKTYWMLTRRGKRFADLSATITIPAVAGGNSNEKSATTAVIPAVEAEHSYALQAAEQPQDTSPMSETFERIDYMEPSDVLDEEGSLISGITVCKSAAVDQDDYDLIPGNCDLDQESEDELDGRDSSYVSIASPVVVDDSPDTTNDLTEMWQRLSMSLSSLGAPTSEAETCRLVDVEVEIEGEGECKRSVDAEVPMEQKAETECLVERVEDSSPEPHVETESARQEDPSATNDVENQQDNHSLASDTTTDSAIQSEPTTNEAPKSASTSRSNSFDSKRQQVSETVTNAISNALLTTTQTLATVGATAKEIHTMVTTIVRTNFNAHNHGGKDSKEAWQPPRAWVPKATQTTWTPAENEVVRGMESLDTGYSPYARQITQLTDMGFFDLEKNERLLRENHGNLDRVVLILLDEKCRGENGL